MEAVYVIELPSGSIKIGRSDNLLERLKQHAGIAQRYNFEIGQIWSSPVRDSRLAERRLLTAIRTLPDVIASSSGETFTGASFFEVMSLARCICTNFEPLPEIGPKLNENTKLPADLELIREIFHRHGDPSALPTVEVVRYFNDVDPRELAQRMRDVGVHAKAVRLGVKGSYKILRGYSLSNILHAVDVARQKTSWGILEEKRENIL